MKKPSNITRREFVTATAAGFALTGVPLAALSPHISESHVLKTQVAETQVSQKRSDATSATGPFRALI